MFYFLNSSKFKLCFLFIFSFFLIPFSVFANEEINLDDHITNTDLPDDHFEVVYHNTELNYTYRENSSLHDFFADQGISLYADLPTQLPITISFLDFTGEKTNLFNTYIDLPVGDSSFETAYVIDIYLKKNCWNDEMQIYLAPYLEPDLANTFSFECPYISTVNGISVAQMNPCRVQGFGFNEDSVTYDTPDNLFYWGEEMVDYYHLKQAFVITQPDTIPTLNFTIIASPLSNFNVYDYSGEELLYTAIVCGQQQIESYYDEFNYDYGSICIRTNLNTERGQGNVGKFIYPFNKTDVLGFSFNPYSNELLENDIYYQYLMSEFFEEDINIYVCPHDINTIVSDHNFSQSQDILDSKIDNFENVVQEYNKIYKPEFKQENFHITYQNEVNNFASNTFEPILKNDLVIKLLICCLTVCLCAYILFGKRS